MGKRSRSKARGSGTSGYIKLQWHLYRSQGWHDLSVFARLAYIELVNRHNGRNNGSIGLSARSLGECIGCDKATASRALRELEDAGFIETTKIGSFSKRDQRASEYRLLILPCDVTGELLRPRFNHSPWRPAKQSFAVTGETEAPLTHAERQRRYRQRKRDAHGTPSSTQA